MVYNTQEKGFTLSIQEISKYLNLNPIALHRKAKRQEWSHFTEPHTHGNPIHLYPLDLLPNEIQIAWAGWDEEKYNQARAEEELKGESGRPEKIPKPVTENMAEEALAWPVRETWAKVYPPGQAPRKAKKVYNGKSRGLCPQARELILKRFPNLNFIKSDQKPRYEKPGPEPAVLEEPPSPYRDQQPMNEVERLQGDIDLYKILVDEKDRGIMILERFISRQDEEIRRLEKQVKLLEQKLLDAEKRAC